MWFRGYRRKARFTSDMFSLAKLLSPKIRKTLDSGTYTKIEAQNKEQPAWVKRMLFLLDYPSTTLDKTKG